MALTADPGPRGLRIDAGVIEDARTHRNHRRRRYWASLVLVVLIAAVAAYATFGGAARARFTVPRPGAVTGSLRPLSPSGYQLYASPGLFPGDATLSIEIQFASGGFDGAGLAVYPGSGVPINPPGPFGYLQANTLPVGRDYVLVVAANVAAVRVGNLGIVGARSAPGLPAGEKLVAFRVPPSSSARPLPARQDVQALRRALQAERDAPVVSLTALDRSGYPLSSAATNRAVLAATGEPLTPVAYGKESPQAKAVGHQRALAMTTHGGGRCAVTTGLPGYNHLTVALKTITPLPQAVPGLFLSCLNDNYIYSGATFNVAILLDAHRPGHQPASLWSATPVPGHPGIVEITPPPGYPESLRSATPVPGHPGTVEIKAQPGHLLRFANSPTPLLARRVPGAWLVEQATPKFSGAIVRHTAGGIVTLVAKPMVWRYPDFAEQVKVLNSFHVTRLDLSHR
jgi:hypothetical protein